ncbi:hypothetical protein LAZ40_06365 [Cereibacter sphaeroides]|uniref:spike base protein, RCAP_Rcc01079 family n=1 Tax=Cereibacter sphaeroides TaxID=1063 RepID=UPI001F47B504|nr:hypothetical protein [Cereibacter sphaeroides]MCE6950247.1 hypothetical protein [Cereibacter sphaeroides]MCE6958671.1 hypothetical protein [Cereibacter sphaeroides]MCE6967565.1 hypothetical protein [Cereibacter sphaeroides]MCE6973446.1 hypothetical protein [Cereibacter sphaeroides]
MKEPFKNHNAGLTAPASGAMAITPSDANDLASAIRAVTLGGEGTLSFMGWDGQVHTTGPLPVGTYALLACRIRATGTTATNITGWV